MKKIFLLALAFIAIQLNAQKWQDPLLYGKKENRISAKTVFMFPSGCGNPSTLNAIDSAINQAASYFDSCNHRYWLYDPKLKAWDSLHLGTLGGGSWGTIIGTLTDQIDLRDSLWARVRYSDTAAMLANYRHWLMGYLTNITGLISAGANIGISGSGTVGSPYVISSTGGGGGDSIALYGRARVDSATGNDVTAVVGNPAKPFATINAALDALALYYKARIDVGFGSYAKIDSSKIRSNLVIYGSGMPMLDNNDTSTSLVNLKITEPTKLVGGTVIKGRLSVRNMPNNVEIAYLGFDNGSAYVALGNPKGDCIDFRHPGTASGATPPFPLMKGLYFHDLVCLGDTSNSLYHSLTIENAIDPVVKNVLLVGNTHGLAVKTVGGIYDGITSYWHTSDGIILKINNYAPSHEMVLSNFNIRSLSESARESGGLVFQNETGVAARTGYVISNGAIRFTSEGIRDYGNVMYNVAISNVTIHKTTNSGFYNTILAKSYFNNIVIDSTGGYGVWQTTTTGGNTFNSVYASNNTYGGFTIAGGTDKTYLYNCAANSNGNYGISATDANVYVENYSAASNSLGATTGTINAVPRPYLVDAAKSLVGATTAGVPYPIVIGNGLAIHTGGGRDTLVNTGSGGGGSINVSDSGWVFSGNTVSTGIKYMGTLNNRSVNFITNNIIRIKMDSAGNFDFNPGAAAGYQYNFAAYSDASFFQYGYGNVSYSGATFGKNVSYGGAPRLRLLGYDNVVPLLSMGDDNASTIRFFRYSSNGVGMKTTNNGNIPFTFGGGYAFKSNTRFGDSVLTTATTSYVDLAPGTTSTSPLGFATGPVISTPLAGKMEYTTPQLFFTNGELIRQEIPQIQQTMVVSQFDKTSNTTLGNVTNLTANVAAGKTYRFEAKLYTSSGSSGGVKVAIGGTSSATTITYEGLTTDAGLTTQSRTTTMGNAVGAVTAVTAAYILITGTITTDAGGTLTVQFAQNASDAATSSVLWGSTFVVTQMNY